jgi:hypothetical protein
MVKFIFKNKQLFCLLREEAAGKRVDEIDARSELLHVTALPKPTWNQQLDPDVIN